MNDLIYSREALHEVPLSELPLILLPFTLPVKTIFLPLAESVKVT